MASGLHNPIVEFAMSVFWFVLLFSVIGSIGALTGAGILLLFPRLHECLKIHLLSFAIGTLLGATFIGLLPEAIEAIDARSALQVVLAGFVLFFILEKIIRIPHGHAHSAGHKHIAGHEMDKHVQPAGILILIGDAFHNFVDGVLIATAFVVSIPLGIVTALAVIAHEIPQELGDFVILIESGMSRIKAYWANFASALTTVIGAMLTFYLHGQIETYSPYIIAIAASSFLYIATVDLSPILHHYTEAGTGLKQTVGIATGILTILLIHFLIK
jgi:zinc and cadmium transporter